MYWGVPLPWVVGNPVRRAGSQCNTAFFAVSLYSNEARWFEGLNVESTIGGRPCQEGVKQGEMERFARLAPYCKARALAPTPKKGQGVYIALPGAAMYVQLPAVGWMI